MPTSCADAMDESNCLTVPPSLFWNLRGKGTATSPEGWAKTGNSPLRTKSTAKPRYVKDAFLELSSLYRN